MGRQTGKHRDGWGCLSDVGCCWLARLQFIGTNRQICSMQHAACSSAACTRCAHGLYAACQAKLRLCGQANHCRQLCDLAGPQYL